MQSAKLFEAAATLKAPADELPARIATLLEERRNLEREISELRQQVAMGGGSTDDAPGAKEIGGVSLASRTLDGVPAKELKPLVDSLKSQLGSGVVAVVSVIDGKASLVVGVEHREPLPQELHGRAQVLPGVLAEIGRAHV